MTMSSTMVPSSVPGPVEDQIVVSVGPYMFSIVAPVDARGDYTDRRIYNLQRPDDAEQIPKYSFDWQRTFKTKRSIDKKSLSDEINKAQKSSLEFFESIAIGDLFDVEN